MTQETKGPPVTSEQRKSNIGIRMTILYTIFYGGFVVLSVFFPSAMGAQAVFGLNLAIAYGIALIIIAIIFAIIYNALVRHPNGINPTKRKPKFQKKNQEE